VKRQHKTLSNHLGCSQYSFRLISHHCGKSKVWKGKKLTVPNSHYNAQFAFETPRQPEAPKPSTRQLVINKLGGSVVATGIVVGAVVGGAVGAGTAIATSVVTGGNSTVIVNNAQRVNWVTAVSQKAAPSVVTISVGDSTQGGSGSGVVLTKDGYILTNTHVVTMEGATGNAAIEVRTADDKVYSATIVGTDPTNDLAVIKINPIAPLVPASFANSDQINVGDSVVAIGSPLGLDATVTSGIVSALNRSIQVANSAAPENGATSGSLQMLGNASAADAINLSVIQTDAAINPGNSGGALLNDRGEVVGINVAIASAGSASFSQAGSIGVGFAIPANNAHRIAQEIMKTGKAKHAMLGAYITDAMSSKSDAAVSIGAKVSKLMPGGPAAKSGLKVGDVVTKLDGRTINSAQDLTAAVRLLAPNTQVTLTVLRAGVPQEIQVTLGDAVNLK
jgi:putative serine protease PepD